MSESDKPPQRGAGGRWLKGHDYVKPWRDPTLAHGSRKLQEELQGMSGPAVLKRLFRAKSVPVMHALKRVILDSDTPPSIKVEATRVFLEYGWGKPKGKRREPGAAKKQKVSQQNVVVVSNVPRSPHKKSGGV